MDLKGEASDSGAKCKTLRTEVVTKAHYIQSLCFWPCSRIQEHVDECIDDDVMADWSPKESFFRKKRTSIMLIPGPRLVGPGALSSCSVEIPRNFSEQKDATSLGRMMGTATRVERRTRKRKKRRMNEWQMEGRAKFWGQGEHEEVRKG